MAQRTGIAVDNLRKLESADWCTFEDVKKLCKEPGIEEPHSCVKERFEG